MINPNGRRKNSSKKEWMSTDGAGTKCIDDISAQQLYRQHRIAKFNERQQGTCHES
jgi:hypothetical protein